MRVGLVVGAAVGAACLTLTACSSGSSKSSAKPAQGGASTTIKASSETNAPVRLPPNTPRNEQFCALTSTIAAKFKGAKRPDGPAEIAPYIRDLAGFFQEVSAVTPAGLAPDVQKLKQFYGALSARLESGDTAPSLPTGLSDLADASRRVRLYFSSVCGVDDTVFNF